MPRCHGYRRAEASQAHGGSPRGNRARAMAPLHGAEGGEHWGSVRPWGHGCRAGEWEAPHRLPACWEEQPHGPLLPTMRPRWEEGVRTDMETGTRRWPAEQGNGGAR